MQLFKSPMFRLSGPAGVDAQNDNIYGSHYSRFPCKQKSYNRTFGYISLKPLPAHSMDDRHLHVHTEAAEVDDAA